MSMLQLLPKQGLYPNNGPIGGTVSVIGPNVPNLSPGPLLIQIQGAVAAPGTGVGMCFPWNRSVLAYVGAIASDGSLDVFETVPAGFTGTVAGSDDEGIAIGTGINPDGSAMSPFGFSNVTQFLPAGPPPPPPVLGLANLVSAVETSWTSKVPVADWRSQGTVVSFIAQPPYMSAPQVVTIWSGECLNSVGSQAIASLLGGTVVQVVPPGEFAAFALPPVPTVNGVQFTYNGVLMVAVAGEVAQAFDQPIANLSSAILACFKPVGA